MITGELRTIFLTTNVFLYKFDISQGYHHIDIDDNYQKYFGFFWKIDGKIIYFMFIVLPFSFGSALFIFTKVMPCLVKILEKGRDKKICVFIDNGFGAPLEQLWQTLWKTYFY